MKCKLQKNLHDYRLLIVDMDGTLYYQMPLRFCMAVELLVYYLLHIRRIREIFALRTFRKNREAGILAKDSSLVNYWMQEKPLRYIYRFRDKKLLRFIKTMQEQGAKIAVYSDYPVRRKINALGIAPDYEFCADDPDIQCLKPDVKGIQHIVKISGCPSTDIVFIGDRYEKDGLCAEGAGVDYIILDPLFRYFNVYKKLPCVWEGKNNGSH